MLSKRYSIALLVILLWSSLTWGQNVIQDYGKPGLVNWISQEITTTGVGTPNPELPTSAQKAAAIEKAKQAAIKNIVAILMDIPLNSIKTVKEELENNSMLRSRLETVTRNFTVTDIRTMSTSDIEVDVNMSLTGPLADFLLPQKFGGGTLLRITQPLCPLCGQVWPEGKPVPEGVHLVMPEKLQNDSDFNAYTGLIIDARNLDVVPAIVPKIIDEDGNIIYGPPYVNRSYAVEFGLTAYSNNIEKAKEFKRVGENPLLIKAVQAEGVNKTDIVVSNSDAKLIHAAAAHINFLDHCRVVFVID